MSDVQISIIDEQQTEIVLAVPGIQGNTGPGVPSGGTQNQILIKQSGVDYDTVWADDIDVQGTLDVTGDATFDQDVTIEGDLTVNGTTTTIDTTTLVVEDKNIEMGAVGTPTDTTADGGGITLKGATDKTLNWVNATDAWTSSEHVDLASGKEFYIDGNGVLNATTLGSGVVNSSLTSVGTIATGTWQGTAIDAAYLDATVVTTSDTGTVTSTMISDGAIVNDDINASAAIADTKLDTISTAGKVSNSATTATDANTANAIVARDASGDFTAGTITADLTGNADTATALETARDIGGVSFDGTANINLPGVNTTGNQDTSGNAATATKLDSSRTFEVTGDVTGTVSSDLTSGASIATSIASGVIVNADVNASAAIAGTKIDPDFGSQTVETTGVFSAAGGAEATPSIAFTGDLDTGIYSPSADQLAISTNGTQALYIDSDGDILVADGNRMEIDEIRARDGAGLKLFDDGGAGIFIKDGGNVGLGTSSPQAKMEIFENAGGLDLVTPLRLSGTALNNDDGWKLQFYNNTASQEQGSLLVQFKTAGSWKTSLTSTNNVTFDTAGNERVRIDSSGNVGIGTTSPGVALHVDGDIRCDGVYGETDTNTSIQFPGSDVITFNEGGSEAARIDSSGRLLVGTSSARSNLDIADALWSPQFQLEGTALNNSSISLIRNTSSTGTASARIILGKSNGASVGSNTIVAADDLVGQIVFNGNDGTNFIETASIGAEIDGTPGTDDMPGRLVFSTTADGAASPTERMRIRNGGATSLFTSEANCLLARSTSSAGVTNLLIQGLHSATDNTNGTFCFLVRSNGNVENTNNSYGPISSDKRLKQDIVDAGSQWDDIKAVRLTKFRYKNDPTGELQLGPIAQELEQVSPGLITRRPVSEEEVADASNDLVDGDEVLSFKASILYMKAIGALQEAMERIEVLEQRLTDAGIA